MGEYSEEDIGNIVSLEHINVQIPDQSLATLFYVVGMGGTRVTTPGALTEALAAAIKADQPRLIHVPVGPMPDPWKFVHLPRVRG